MNLEVILHPNHCYIFIVKEKFLLSRLKANVNEDMLKERIVLGQHLIGILDQIDPGLTQRKGNLLKVLAKDEMSLAQLVKCQKKKSDLIAQCANDLRVAGKCFKYLK